MGSAGVEVREVREGFFAAPDRRDGWVVRADEATLAVVAHGLLRSITVVQGGVETLLHRGNALDDRARDEIMHAVMDHAVLIGASLQDLVRGLTCTEVPSTDDIERWEQAAASTDQGCDQTHAPSADGACTERLPRRTGPNWVPTYAHCPKCRYRGVYVVQGRRMIRCRYCRAMASLTDAECGVAIDDPGRYATRLTACR